MFLFQRLVLDQGIEFMAKSTALQWLCQKVNFSMNCRRKLTPKQKVWFLLASPLKMCKFFTTKTTSWPPYTTFVPLFSPSYRKWMYIINNVTSSMSLFNHSQIIRARDMTFRHNVHHTLCVMCLVSHVRCHMSLIMSHLSQFFIYFLFTNCWS